MTPGRSQSSREAGFVRKYRFGFSLIGLVAVLIPLAPNVLWALLPPVSSPITTNTSGLLIIDIAGTVCQSLMIALLILVISTRRRPAPGATAIAAIAVTCLAGYLLMWILYFSAPITPILILMMAVLPSIYFICVSLDLKNYPALVPAALFAVIHTSTTVSNYL